MAQVEQTGTGGTVLGAMVRAGAGQKSAEKIHDFIWMSKDVSNSYLVTGADENLVINAGMPKEGGRHLAAYRAVSANPIRNVILTQGHFDHFGGIDAFAQAGAQILAHKDFPNVRAYWTRLGPFYTRRSNQLWGNVLTMGHRPLDFHSRLAPKIDQFLEDGDEFTFGSRKLRIIAVSGGETIDSVAVWLPEERVVFTGNLFGPLFLNQPNLNTLRGDLPRNVLRFVEAVKKVQALNAEMLITGHGEPIRGVERINADLQKLADAVTWLHDETVAGMNAGKTVHQLMRDIVPPPELQIGQGHGKVAINIRSIWEQYSGFFHYCSTTELYEVPASSVSADIVELAGGTAALTAQARKHLAAERPLEALHLLGVVLDAKPRDADALGAFITAHEQLLERGKSENFSETMWLKAQISNARATLEQAAAEPA